MIQNNPYNPSGTQAQLGRAPSIEANSAKYEKYEAQRELTKAISGSQEVLVEATTVFPFTFFPDNLTVDRSQVTIVHRAFIKMGDVISIRIEDILNVEATVGPFFGSLQIYTRFYNARRPYHVNWLWRSDALRIKRILHGYLIATKKQIDCSSLNTKELASMLDELGKGTSHDET